MSDSGEARFSVSRLTQWLEPYVELKRAVLAEMPASLVMPALSAERHDTASQREALLRQVREAVRCGLTPDNPSAVSLPPAAFRSVFAALRSAAPVWPISYSLHLMFAGVVESLGTQKHADFFRAAPRIRSLEVFGCFALTELTHGSNSQGIQTTATYNPDSKTFSLQSKRNAAGTPVGAKWWVGNAGKHATHAVVGARLIVGNVERGLHFFLVQLRDLKTMDPCPNITVGDIGPKPGLWNHMDNGFMVFDNVELPASALLDRYQRVTDAGEYQVMVDPKKRFGLTLGALSGGRVGITSLASGTLGDVMIISIRYSAKRRQFGLPSRGMGHEDPVLTYPLQQVRLLPFLGGVFAVRFFSQWLGQVFDECASRGASGDDSAEFLAYNAELHAISCGAKAFSTWYTSRAISESRLACGGHGFSSSAGIHLLRDLHEPSQSYEGDNNVLLQQLERWMLNAVQQETGDTLSPLGSIDILKPFAEVHNSGGQRLKSSWDGGDASNLDIEAALAHRTCYLLSQASTALAERMMSFGGGDKSAFKDHAWKSWNDSQPGDLQSSAKAFIEALVYKKAAETITATAPSDLRPVMEDCLRLFGMQILSNDLATLLESGYFSANQSRATKRSLVQLCAKLAPDALALVDAYAPPDAYVRSTLAKGSYEDNLWQSVKHKTDRVSYWKEARTPVEPLSKGDVIAAARARAKL